MGVTSLYDFTKQLTEMQSQIRFAPEYPTDLLRNYLIDISNQTLNLTEIQQAVMSNLSRLNIFPFPIGNSQSSQYVALDTEDGINEDCVPITNSGNVSSGRIVQRTSKDSTSSADINRMNEEFHSSLSKRTQTFVWTLKHTDFEDGVELSLIHI